MKTTLERFNECTFSMKNLKNWKNAKKKSLKAISHTGYGGGLE